MGDRLGRVEINRVADQVAADVNETGGHIQQRTLDGMVLVLTAMSRGDSVRKSCADNDVGYTAYLEWKKRYPAFRNAANRTVALNRAAVHAAVIERQRQQRAEGGLVWDPDRQVRPRPGLIEFRQEYFGRPTPIHQQAMVQALEDQTNLYVFIFGPTGMGKDTIAGDYVARSEERRVGKECRARWSP